MMCDTRRVLMIHSAGVPTTLGKVHRLSHRTSHVLAVETAQTIGEMFALRRARIIHRRNSTNMILVVRICLRQTAAGLSIAAKTLDTLVSIPCNTLRRRHSLG